MPGLASREAVLLFGGSVLLVGLAFIASRVLRSLRHGFSIRLQLFFAIVGTSLLATGVIGLWVIERLQARAAELAATEVEALDVLLDLTREFGPKLSLLVALLGMAGAGAAFALGRSVATPLERLTRSAEAIARGERHAVLPPPVGREVRRLTAAFESMRRELEDRHHIEQFVADLSHELKNPVSAIRAATEVLLEGAMNDPEARGRFLGRIDEAGRRLEVLLGDLLTLARLEARGVAPEREPFSLDRVVQQAIEGAQAPSEARGVQIEADLAAVKVRGDRRWLRRAVDNLLSNAIRYSPEDGVVRLRLRVEEGVATLTVRDYGPGVAAPIRERLFERFVTDRGEAGQTGLGLAIVRSVAEQHGGHARLLAVDGPGACFEMQIVTG
ncbi:MAG: HAMP domain-containing protein [Myxococcales bacterium]|nr:HAMP domain-containing protein [Myxococcales bacterium]